MMLKELVLSLVESLVSLAKMDLKNLAEQLDQMPMFPYFTLCHIIVCTLNARADLGSGELLGLRIFCYLNKTI